MLWNINFEISAAILLLIITIYFFTSKRMVTRQSNVYIALLVLSLVSSMVHIIRRLMLQQLMDFPLLAHQLVTIVYYLSQLTAYFLMYYYIQLIIVHQFTKKRYMHVMIYIPLIVSVVLLLLTIPFNLAFTMTYNEGMVTHFAMYIVYASLLFYLGASSYWIVFYESKLQFHQKLAFYLSMIFMTSALLIKFIFPDVLMLGFAFALMLLLIYFVIENPKLVTDELTGLFNRAAFIERLQTNVKRKEPFYIITIAMDDFRFINETYGYHYGDMLLKAIGKKLLETSKTVYRYMGDTFCIMVYDDANVMQTINRIKSKLDAPWNINSTVCLLSASFCVVSFPQNADTRNELIDFIDYTIHEAKKVNKGSITFGKNSSKDKIRRNNAIEYLIKEAIQYDRFEVHYQPIYSYKEGRFVAAEALVRLFDDEYGYISPAEFIPLAEKNGSILKIGLIVFEKVCQFLKENQMSQYGIEYIEVNLSVLQCMQRRLSSEMIDIMKKYQIDPSQINFELTESAVAESKGMLETTMNELIDYGCSFSLDDFGTGFSNISYVTQLPFNIVKIDKGLIWAALGSNKVKTAIAHLISMFKKMDMKIVAEGVETKEQLEMLVEMECDFIQGYYYSKPLKQESFQALMQEKAVKA